MSPQRRALLLALQAGGSGALPHTTILVTSGQQLPQLSSVRKLLAAGMTRSSGTGQSLPLLWRRRLQQSGGPGQSRRPPVCNGVACTAALSTVLAAALIFGISTIICICCR